MIWYKLVQALVQVVQAEGARRRHLVQVVQTRKGCTFCTNVPKRLFLYFLCA